MAVAGGGTGSPLLSPIGRFHRRWEEILLSLCAPEKESIKRNEYERAAEEAKTAGAGTTPTLAADSSKLGGGHNQGIILHDESGGGALLGAWRYPTPSHVAWGGGTRITFPNTVRYLLFLLRQPGIVLYYHTRHQRGPLAALAFNYATRGARPYLGDGA